MSAATATPGSLTPGPLNPLAGVDRALRGFRDQLAQVSRSFPAVLGEVRRADSAAARVRGGADPAGTALRQFGTATAPAAAALSKAGGSAGPAATRIRTGGGKARSVTAPLTSLASGSAAFGAVAGPLGKASGTVSTFMTVFGGALTVAAGAMTAVNVAMRANPIGFLIGLLVPVAGFLIEYALTTQTGQRVMRQVFDGVLTGFQEIGKFLGPVVQGYATVISAHFSAVRTVVTTVLKVVGALVTGNFGAAGKAIGSATRAVTGLIRKAWNGFRSVIQPVLDWITRKIPDMFTRVRDAMSRTLHGIGDFLTTGMQMLLSVVKGPLSGLIAFANWVIDGLNSLSFSVLGKKFGVHLSKIPQLAAGGVVLPARAPGGAGSVLPLSALDRLAPADGTKGPYGSSAPYRPYRVPPGRTDLHTYYETRDSGPLAIAEDLLFLHRTAA
ncbi:tape-measure protein [Streptomyces sp. NPDC056730]|uniref:tape-measure protein n=1 Tax=unclassified Streptomyces TaxID=2593676 RepID=UPI00367B64F9